jgi:uncharacterized protein (DUF1330 family)
VVCGEWSYFEFPSLEEARHWYTGPAYQEVKKRREGAANFDLILVEGDFVYQRT